MAAKIYTQIEQTANLYGPVTYASLLTRFHDIIVGPEDSSFIPLTAVTRLRAKDRVLFAVGIIPPAANVTGRLLDRSASVQTISEQAALAAEAAASHSRTGGGPAGESTSEAVPSSANAGNGRHREARVIMTKAFEDLMGRPPTLEEIQYIQAVAFGETGYGAWRGKPEMHGSHNWGAVHCPSTKQTNSFAQSLKGLAQSIPILGRGNPECIQSTDSNPNGSGFEVSFRAYSTAHDGAKDVVRNIMKARKATAEALSSGRSVFDASYAMRRETYYGGFCLDAVKQYGPQAGTAGGLRDPDRTEGTRACAEEAITGHANGIKAIIDEIAASCGDPSSMGLGSYAGADAWWRQREEAQNAANGGPVGADGTGGNWQGSGSGHANDLNKSDLGQALQAAQRAQIAETRARLDAMANTPPLKMLVNPQKFGVKGEKIATDGSWTRSGPVIEHWGDGQDKISASGKLAGFYAIDAKNAAGPGLTRTARNHTESWANFQSLYQLYRNNGGLYINDPLTGGKTQNLSHVGSVYIYYDTVLYIGSFDTFSITESDSAPFSVEYSFEFTVRAAFSLDRQDDEVDYGAPNLLPSVPTSGFDTPGGFSVPVPADSSSPSD